MSIKRRSAFAAAALMASTVALAAPAHASGISVGGDSNWGITSQSSVSTHYPSLGNSVTATENLVYSAHFLGIPIPVTGHYMLTFPYAPFSRPTLLSANANMNSWTYSYAYDAYMGKSAWVVRGQSDFWGSKTVYLKGAGQTDTRNATGYVHGGTGTGHSIDVNSIDYVAVR